MNSGTDSVNLHLFLCYDRWRKRLLGPGAHPLKESVVWTRASDKPAHIFKKEIPSVQGHKVLPHTWKYGIARATHIESQYRGANGLSFHQQHAKGFNTGR
jgi:hypothetical protein